MSLDISGIITKDLTITSPKDIKTDFMAYSMDPITRTVESKLVVQPKMRDIHDMYIRIHLACGMSVNVPIDHKIVDIYNNSYLAPDIPPGTILNVFIMLGTNINNIHILTNNKFFKRVANNTSVVVSTDQLPTKINCLQKCLFSFSPIQEQSFYARLYGYENYIKNKTLYVINKCKVCHNDINVVWSKRWKLICSKDCEKQRKKNIENAMVDSKIESLFDNAPSKEYIKDQWAFMSEEERDKILKYINMVKVSYIEYIHEPCSSYTLHTEWLNTAHFVGMSDGVVVGVFL